MKPLWSHLADLFVRQRELAGAANALLMFGGAFTAYFFRREHRELFGLDIFRDYLGGIDGGDVLFHLSHRHYLSKALSYRQRVQCALTHYQFEGRGHDLAYKEAVYRGQGLELWSETVDETRYSLKLRATTELRHEGGISVVLYADDTWLSEMSYSWVDATIFGLESGVVPFVTRNQSVRHDADSLRRFRSAFPQNSPRYFCLAALEGVVMAHGAERVLAVKHDSQVAFAEEFKSGFRNSYCDFWKSFGATELDRQAYVMPLPTSLAPVGEVKAKHRRRAIERRRYRSAITDNAMRTMALRRVGPAPEPQGERAKSVTPWLLAPLAPHLDTVATLALSI